MGEVEAALGLVLADGTAVPGLPWQVEGKFEKGRDLSGIACDRDGRGLVATDEGSLLQPFRLDRAASTLRVGPAGTALLRAGEEADYEGLGWADGWFYAIGSHARGRKKPDHQPSRHHLYRVRLGPDGGIAATETSHGLGALLGADPVLGGHYHRRLDAAERGIDVEGVALRAGQVLLGLRSPSLAGQAFVLEVALADLFEPGGERQPQARRHALALGEQAGIRDLAAVPGGVLVLSGPSVDGDQAPFGLWLWADDGGLVPLATFAALGEAKAEGLLVLAAEADGLEVLVLFDGVRQGRPHAYRLPRPA